MFAEIGADLHLVHHRNVVGLDEGVGAFAGHIGYGNIVNALRTVEPRRPKLGNDDHPYLARRFLPNDSSTAFDDGLLVEKPRVGVHFAFLVALL